MSVSRSIQLMKTAGSYGADGPGSVDAPWSPSEVMPNDPTGGHTPRGMCEHLDVPPATVSELIAEYRQALVDMDAMSLEQDRGARSWNAQVHKVQRAQLTLRETSEGRAAITFLIDDPVPTVARWAASHALFWDEEAARKHLEKEQAAGRLDASTTLKEFDAGRLRHDWQPPKQG